MADTKMPVDLSTLFPAQQTINFTEARSFRSIIPYILRCNYISRNQEVHGFTARVAYMWMAFDEKEMEIKLRFSWRIKPSNHVPQSFIDKWLNIISAQVGDIDAMINYFRVPKYK